MIKKKAVWTLLALAGIPSAADARELPNMDASRSGLYQSAASLKPVRTQRLAISGRDELRGQPTFARATRSQEVPAQASRMSLEAVARHYLQQNAAVWGLSSRALETVELEAEHQLGGGATLVSFSQRVDGIEVFRERLSLLMDKERRLVAMSGYLNPEARPGMLERSGAFRITDLQAVSTAFLDLHGTLLVPQDLVEQGERRGLDRFFVQARTSSLPEEGYRLTGPLRTRPVLFSTAEGLKAAYFIELMTQDLVEGAQSAYAYVIDARSGEVLLRENLTHEASYNYRVYAQPESTGRPTAGPVADYLPHPTGSPDGWYPGFEAPALVAADGFNSKADPWLPDGATQTIGNAGVAYVDLASPDYYSTGDLYGGQDAEGEFDFTYDVTLTPSANTSQRLAAANHLFYVGNWLHDYWYDSGFNETAYNAQEDNFDRGGLDEDPLELQGQDYSGTNNANMSVPSDGISPRMQMYVWSGYREASLTVLPLGLKPSSLGTGAFGPTNFDLAATPLVLMNDGSGTTSDGCQTVPAGTYSGKVVAIDRGTCTFELKTLQAQNAGAVGVIIMNNQGGTTVIQMADDANTPNNVTIPVLSITQNDGTTLKTALASTTAQTAALKRITGVDHDGTLDSSIIAHEWGHYLHKRLLVTCNSQQCNSQSEGWADFVALHLLMDEGDPLDATYAVAVYAGIQYRDAAYYGIRRYPYSTNFSKNPLTFTHIQEGVALPTTAPMGSGGSTSNSEVHNAGEVWANMVWEGYAELLEDTLPPTPVRTFDEVQRAMSDYIVGGMLLAPANPTFTEQRDALLAAMSAINPPDAVRFAEQFAVRGAGTCAISPARTSTDLKGVTESYTLAPVMQLGEWTLNDALGSCDSDGVLDAGEQGYLTYSLINSGPAELPATKLVFSSTTAGLSFPEGETVTMPALAPYSTGEVQVAVALSSTAEGFQTLDIKADITNDTACVKALSDAISLRSNLDDIPNASETDTVESQYGVWNEEIVLGRSAWTRLEKETYKHVWYGLDNGKVGDVRLVSPSLNVSRTSPLIITFEHLYKFEASDDDGDGVVTFWDGGVLEISKDNGTTWEDIAVYANPGYDGVITDTSENPLMNRQAYSGSSPGYPSATETVYLNLKTALAGKTIKLRFRIGTDQAASDYGWEVDNIAFSGITNLPFGAVVEDSADVPTVYQDGDGDGYGNASASLGVCKLPTGYVTNSTDCDDTKATVYPSNAEVCDGLDNNCNERIDEDATDAQTYYVDADEDGVGDSTTAVTTCIQPEGTVTLSGDCDDTNPEMAPSFEETCDGFDNDCNGTSDDNAVDGSTVYADLDADSYGDAASTLVICAPTEGYVSDATDCNDSSSAVNPGAAEVCDEIDNNCDGSSDNNPTDGTAYYFDEDADGFGVADNSVVACAQPAGYSDNGADCDDSAPLNNPDAPEVCDLEDNDCDETVDEGALDAPSWYYDGDGDGFGAESVTEVSCSQPAEYVPTSGDCDDTNPMMYPGAAEEGNDGIDYNCDGEVQEATPVPTPVTTPTPADTPTQTPVEEPTATATPEVTPTEAPTDAPTEAPTDEPNTFPGGGGGCTCDAGNSSSQPTQPVALGALLLATLLGLKRRRDQR